MKMAGVNSEDLSYLSEEEKQTLAGLQPAAKALFLKMRQETATRERAKVMVEESSARKRRREVLDDLEEKLDEDWIKKTKQGGDEEVGLLAEGVKALKQEMDWLTNKQVICLPTHSPISLFNYGMSAVPLFLLALSEPFLLLSEPSFTFTVEQTLFYFYC